MNEEIIENAEEATNEMVEEARNTLQSVRKIKYNMKITQGILDKIKEELSE